MWTFEQAVRREVFEEVGLRVKNVTYYKSQPWPFPDSVMIGFFAELDGDASITLQESELAEAVWFERQNIPPTLTNTSIAQELIECVRNGVNDRFILFAIEPIAHGFHIAFPYGSWLQNQVKDAFWPDLRVLRKLGPWLDEHDNCLGKDHVADIAVLYDSASAYENNVSEPAVGGENTYNQVKPISLDGVKELGRQGAFSNQGNFGHFFRLVQDLSDRHVLYNVLFHSPDEPLTVERLAGYRTVPAG